MANVLIIDVNIKIREVGKGDIGGIAAAETSACRTMIHRQRRADTAEQ